MILRVLFWRQREVERKILRYYFKGLQLEDHDDDDDDIDNDDDDDDYDYYYYQILNTKIWLMDRFIPSPVAIFVLYRSWLVNSRFQ